MSCRCRGGIFGSVFKLCRNVIKWSLCCFLDTFYRLRKLKRSRSMWETSCRAPMGKRGSLSMSSSADGRRLKDRPQIQRPQVFSFSKNLFHQRVSNKRVSILIEYTKEAPVKSAPVDLMQLNLMASLALTAIFGEL